MPIDVIERKYFQDQKGQQYLSFTWKHPNSTKIYFIVITTWIIMNIFIKSTLVFLNNVLFFCFAEGKTFPIALSNINFFRHFRDFSCWSCIKIRIETFSNRSACFGYIFTFFTLFSSIHSKLQTTANLLQLFFSFTFLFD